MKTTLDEMHAFIAVVDTGSITAAAERLGQTISATSRTRRMELTGEGKAYLERARAIITAVEDAEALMSAHLAMPAGLLRVDAASPFMLHVIVPAVLAYRARYPQVSLELNSNEGIIDLLERRTDVAIRIGRLKDSTLHATPIGSSRIRVLASPAYLAAHGTPANVDDLARHVLLGFSQPESLNDWPLAGSDGETLHITPTVRSSSGETVRQLALADVGIACLSDFMTRDDRRSGRLVQCLVAQTIEVRQAVNAVYYRNSGLSSRIDSFVAHLKGTLGEAGFDD